MTACTLCRQDSLEFVVAYVITCLSSGLDVQPSHLRVLIEQLEMPRTKRDPDSPEDDDEEEGADEEEYEDEVSIIHLRVMTELNSMRSQVVTKGKKRVSKAKDVDKVTTKVSCTVRYKHPTLLR
jgi:hypothetical protein